MTKISLKNPIIPEYAIPARASRKIQMAISQERKELSEICWCQTIGNLKKKKITFGKKIKIGFLAIVFGFLAKNLDFAKFLD